MIAVFDLDGTLLSHNSSFAFCCFLRKQGILSFADLLYCLYHYASHRLLHTPLKTLHTRVFARLFRGKSAALLEAHVPAFMRTLKWYAPAVNRLKTLQADGYDIRIFSSSPHFLVQPIAESIGVMRVVATEYSLDPRGHLVELTRLVDGEQKRQELRALGHHAIAFSDSEIDLPFLEAAHKAVAVNPTRRLAKVAEAKGWERL